MIEIGERLGLMLLYLFVAGCAVLALSLFARALVTLLSGKRQRRGMPEGAYEAYRPSNASRQTRLGQYLAASEH